MIRQHSYQLKPFDIVEPNRFKRYSRGKAKGEEAGAEGAGEEAGAEGAGEGGAEGAEGAEGGGGGEGGGGAADEFALPEARAARLSPPAPPPLRPRLLCPRLLRRHR